MKEIPSACGRCNRMASKIAQDRVFGTNATMYFVKCTNHACKLRTYACGTEKQAVKDWNTGKVYQDVL
jgi:hypothetical protein